MAEMSSMGIGNKPCLDIRPSADQINDRSISFAQLSRSNYFFLNDYILLKILQNHLSNILKIILLNFNLAAPRFRNSIAGPVTESCRSSKRPHSVISMSSLSSSSTSSGGSQGTAIPAATLIGFDANCDSPKSYYRSGTLNSQCSVGK